MKMIKNPQPNATPQELAQIQKYLIGVFFLNLFLLLAMNKLDSGTYPNVSPSFAFVIDIAFYVAIALLCIILYIADRRLGFGKIGISLGLLLSIFLPFVGLILVLSANVRISKYLRSQGWKVGLLGAMPPERIGNSAN